MHATMCKNNCILSAMNNKEIRNLIPQDLCLYYDTAWIGHGPFAMWSTITFRPKTIVELGTHGGYSYFAFCEAVKKNNLDTQCYAIDTWEGDEHASFYDNSIYENVEKINDEKYSNFSTLVRKRFDEAVDLFADKSIDLLHIDGRHGYEDVKYDFECYKSKLSDQAIVLFHDVNCHKPGFGVHKFFSELKKEFPHTEFEHSSGLGVLFWGKFLNLNTSPYREIIDNLINTKSNLYNNLYLTGLSNKNHWRLARYKNRSQNTKEEQIKIYKFAKKVFIKDMLYSLKLFFKNLTSKLSVKS